MAQHVIPRLRRLHGNEAIPKRNRTTARSCCQSRSDRDHVRGSDLVALPSLAHRGLSESARDGSAEHSRRKQNRTASVHTSGSDCERRIKLRGRVIIVGRLTRSLLLSRPKGLPVYVARVHAAPFCETPFPIGV